MTQGNYVCITKVWHMLIFKKNIYNLRFKQSKIYKHNSSLTCNKITYMRSYVNRKIFLFFINDIADDIQSLVRLFADDSSLIFSSTNPLEVEDRLNLDLQVLDNWAKQWLVDFNPQNTEYMVISFR